MQFFKDREIRRHWDEIQEKWYFSVSDVVAVLSNSTNPLAYWRKLKERLKKEGGNETVTKCHGLKMLAADGKMRLTDVDGTQTLFRIIQSIPSPNAEASTTEISKKVAKEGGSIARQARKRLEKRTGKKVTTRLNAKSLGLLESK